MLTDPGTLVHLHSLFSQGSHGTKSRRGTGLPSLPEVGEWYSKQRGSPDVGTGDSVGNTEPHTQGAESFQGHREGRPRPAVAQEGLPLQQPAGPVMPESSAVPHLPNPSSFCSENAHLRKGNDSAKEMGPVVCVRLFVFMTNAPERKGLF